jgi:hypothetical protein
VCGSFWRVDKIQNGIAMETEVPQSLRICSDKIAARRGGRRIIITRIAIAKQ